MMRITTGLIAAAALIGAAGLLHAAPPTDEQIEKVIKTYDDGMAAKPTDREVIVQLAKDALGDLNVSEMTGAQIGRLLAHGPILQYTQTYPQALERLRTFLESTEVDGAVARIALFANDYRNAQDDEARVEMLRKMISHPSLGRAVAMGAANNLFSNMGNLSDPVIAQARKEILGLERFLKPEYADKLARGYIGYLGLYKKANPDNAADYNRVRQTMATLASGAAAAATDERMAKSYSGIAAYLNGAFARGELIGYKAPEITIDWSSDPSITSLGALKGEVVVLDFWATWCGPCVASFPKVRELVEHYKGYPVRIIGVTSLQGAHYDNEAEEKRIDTTGDPQKEYTLMASYIKTRNLTWPVVFSTEDVFNPEYGVRGIPHVAIIGADGKVKHGGLHPARPLKEKTDLIDALLREAGLPVPAPPVEPPKEGAEG